MLEEPESKRADFIAIQELVNKMDDVEPMLVKR